MPASINPTWRIRMQESTRCSCLRTPMRAPPACGLAELTGCQEPGIVISDSFGRPWRVGTVGVAIGCAGIASIQDLRGNTDMFGRPLRVTVVGHADELAAAA